MELFAYISLEDLDKILRGNHDEVGKKFDEDLTVPWFWILQGISMMGM